jgi:hypothetical protein
MYTKAQYGSPAGAAKQQYCNGQDDTRKTRQFAVRQKRRLGMLKKIWALTLLLGLFPFSALADGPLVRFDGGIGVIPVRAGPAANVVFGVNPGGQPWVIERLRADVKEDGNASVDGRGLLLGGGNGIGTTGGQRVRARLFCGGVAFDSGVVPLETNGDFRIEGVLRDTNGATPPSPCGTPVLLIVSEGGNWFAAGIPKL